MKWTIYDNFKSEVYYVEQRLQWLKSELHYAEIDMAYYGDDDEVVDNYNALKKDYDYVKETAKRMREILDEATERRKVGKPVSNNWLLNQRNKRGFIKV